MEKTVIGKDIGRELIGYAINVPLSPENQQEIAFVQRELSSKIGSPIWNTPLPTLHITLLDWLAPLVDYGRDKTEIFQEIFVQYDRVIAESIKSIGPIAVKFNQLKAGPSAVWIEGTDSGQFQQIRKEFLDGVNLLPNTKLPPQIIHSTIARYKEETELSTVQEVVAGLNCSFVQEISAFRLIKETVDPMLEFETIKTYPLVSVV